MRLDDNMEISIDKKASPEMRKTSYSTYLKVERTDKSYEGRIIKSEGLLM